MDGWVGCYCSLLILGVGSCPPITSCEGRIGAELVNTVAPIEVQTCTPYLHTSWYSTLFGCMVPSALNASFSSILTRIYRSRFRLIPILPCNYRTTRPAPPPSSHGSPPRTPRHPQGITATAPRDLSPTEGRYKPIFQDKKGKTCKDTARRT